MDEESKKSKLTPEQKKFLARAITWSIFAWALPVAFVGWRYSLFEKVGSLQLSGWGLVAIIFTFCFLYVLAKYIKAGFVEWSMLKQVVTGIVKVILPLGALLAISISLRNSLDMFIQALSCTIISEIIAIPVNPFPEWVYKKSQGRFESAVDFVANKFYNTKEDKK